MKSWRSEQGYVIVTVALLIVVLVGFAALAVDTGLMVDTRTGAQRIADAAALAGAFSFVVSPSAPQPSRAEEYAMATATQQNIRGTAPAAENVDVMVDVGTRTVTVRLDVIERTFFGRVLGFNDANIGVVATAEAATNATGSTCTKPWMLPNTVLIPPSATACQACPGDPSYDPGVGQQVLISGGAATPFAQANIGAQFTIKPQSPHNALAPGQFYAIQVSGGTGASVYEDNIASCSGEVFCSECYGVEPGNMVGPTRQGVDRLVGKPPEDTYNSSGPCFDPGCRDTSRGLIVVPVWDVCNISGGSCQTSGFCPGGKFSDSGANITVRVIGFALIFVEGIQGQNVVARLIGVSACAAGGGGGGSGGGGGGGESGPFAVPVRLVQTHESS